MYSYPRYDVVGDGRSVSEVRVDATRPPEHPESDNQPAFFLRKGVKKHGLSLFTTASGG